jgi:hypothetical protein
LLQSKEQVEIGKRNCFNFYEKRGRDRAPFLCDSQNLPEGSPGLIPLCRKGLIADKYKILLSFMQKVDIQLYIDNVEYSVSNIQEKRFP